MANSNNRLPMEDVLAAVAIPSDTQNQSKDLRKTLENEGATRNPIAEALDQIFASVSTNH